MALSPAPPWLNDEAELKALLETVLDRFDKQPGERRRQALYFTAEKHLPTLQRIGDEADLLWRFIRWLAQQQLLTIRPGKRGPYDADWKGARLAFAPEVEATLRHWLARPRTEPALQQWREAVAHHAEAFPGDIDALYKRRIAIPGWNDDTTVAAFARLAGIDTPMTLRQLSARLFAGDSKRLDDKEELVRALFPALPLKPRPLVIAVHLPDKCRGILFIENQDSYALAATDAWPQTENLALVYAAGFRGGAERIRDREAALLHYSGQRDRSGEFENWWYGEEATPPGPLCFFGDLDFSGMAILAALRRRFGPITAWQPGYAALLERLQNGQGHTPDAAGKAQQIDPGDTGCRYADEVLLPAARRFGFIDQEAFNGDAE